MLTPRFELTQTESEVAVTVHAPYANIKDTEVHVDGTDFRFYSTPYYLRLQLPGAIVENDESSGSYDCEKGVFLLKFSKVNVGQHFENLDMITTLLAPPKENKDFLFPKIQIISNPATNDEVVASDEDNEIDSADEWFIPQTAFVDGTATSMILNPPKYGFANKISGALALFDPAWIREVIDLPTPDKVPIEERKKLREIEELKSFSEDHYMADLIDDESVDSYTNFQTDCENFIIDEIFFNDRDKDILKELPNKEYLLNNDDEKMTVLCGLVDIIFASCYNKRITNGENTPESSWNINKLSSTLCWFEKFSSMDEVIRACIRRSLCYPLCRNWNLSVKIFDDLKKSIKLGKKYVIKLFCEIHELFNDSYEPRYLLNQLYIKDYLIWLQQVPETLIESIVPMLDNITPNKAEMGLELEELEVAALSVHGETLIFKNEIDEVVSKMAQSNLDDAAKTIYSKQLGNDSDETDDSDSDNETDTSTTDSDTSSSETDTSTTSSSSSDTSSTTVSKIDNKLDSDDLSDSGSA